MGHIYDALTTFLTQRGIRYAALEGKPWVMFGVPGQNGQYLCSARVQEEEGFAAFYTDYAFNVPEDKRVKAADYLTRASYGLKRGDFEMDMRDGEVRYKTTLDLDGESPTSDMLEHLIFVNLAMADNYLPGLEEVVFTGVDPKVAISHVEG